MYYPANTIHYGEIDSERMCDDGRVEELERGPQSPYLRALYAKFTNGGHTKWHYHDGGQVLIGIEGKGFVELQGLPIVNLNINDRVIIPAGAWHRHGAIKDEMLVHLAVTTGKTTWE